MKTILLQASTSWTSEYLLMYGLVFVVMYIFLFRPMIKKQKKERVLREELKKGDSIITIGGIHGKIVEMKESSVVIESYSVKIQIEKSAIAMNAVSEKLV